MNTLPVEEPLLRRQSDMEALENEVSLVQVFNYAIIGQ